MQNVTKPNLMLLISKPELTIQIISKKLELSESKIQQAWFEILDSYPLDEIMSWSEEEFLDHLKQ